MRLSIVVPTFRRAALLAELLARLEPQLAAFPDAEAIVVDNDPDAGARSVVEGRSQVRYVHEARPGVVNARNRGVGEAAARHIVFLDDDEIPAPGWLAAFAGQAEQGVAASFGRIVPRFETPAPAGLAPIVTALFSRDFTDATGSDVSPDWAALGTGNSMFDVARCFSSGTPFDPRFNARGGEDSWLIRSLMARGIALTWNAEALVEEVVPGSRMTLASLKRRKYNHGQIRVICAYGNGGPMAVLKAAAWMGVGGAQVALQGLRYAALAASRSDGRADAAARLHAGLGKLFWWRAPQSFYAS